MFGCCHGGGNASKGGTFDFCVDPRVNEADEVLVSHKIHEVMDTSDLKAPDTPALLDNTILCLPSGVVNAFGLKPNIEDKGEEKSLWFGRAWQLRALDMIRYKDKIRRDGPPPLTVAEKKELCSRFEGPEMEKLLRAVQKRWKGTACRRRRALTCLTPLMGNFGAFAGTVIFMHGSGGMTYNNVRYARTLAGMGFIVIAPDSLAGSAWRYKSVAGVLRANMPTPYWDDLGVYTSDAEGERAYSTDAQAVITDPDRWRKLYANIYRMRRSELRWVLGHLPQHIKTRGVFTMGQSEGAMVVARFDDQEYGALIKGRIISAFSVEYCYFTPEERDGAFGGSTEVPTLNIIGDLDQFFGPVDSVAKVVSDMKSQGGYGGQINGNAWETMKEQKIHRGVVAVFEGARHDQSTTHDNMLRDLLQAFLSSPGNCHKIPDLWKPDKYLSSKVVLEDRDGEFNERIKLKFLKDEFPSTLPYRRVMIMRQVEMLVTKRQTEMQGYFAADEGMQKRDSQEAHDMLAQLKHGKTNLEFGDTKKTIYDQDFARQTSSASSRVKNASLA